MPRRKKDSDLAQKDLLNVAVQLRTAPCVPALREAVKKWRDDGYKGATDTTRQLLNYWFKSDHLSLNGQPFAYHYFQREAIETLIYVWCENAAALTGTKWRYLKVMQKAFENLRPELFEDLKVLD